MRFSLRSKLITFIIFLIVVSTMVIFLYSSDQFRAQIDAYTKENTLAPLRSAQLYIKSILDEAVSDLKTVHEVSEDLKLQKMKEFVSKDPSFVAFGSISHEDPTKDARAYNDIYVGAQTSEPDIYIDELTNPLKELALSVPQGSFNFFNTSRGNCYCGTMILNVLDRFYYVVVTFDYALDSLKAFQNTPIALVSSDGSIIFHTDKQKMLERVSFKDVVIVSQGLKSDSAKIATLEFEMDKTAMLGSYAKLGMLGMLLVGFASKEQAYQPIYRYEFVLKMFVAVLILIALITTIYLSNMITYPLNALTDATEEIRRGNYGVTVKIYTKDELRDLGEAFNLMSSEITKLMFETAEKAAQDKELETASAVQNNLIPKEHFKNDFMEIGAKYQSAALCGGDWWGTYPLADGKILLMIADATGHGVSSALVTAAANSAASIITFKNMRRGIPVTTSTILEEINYAIHNASKGQINMTFFVAIVDPLEKVISYSNASHNVPYLLKLKALSEDPKNKKAIKPLVGVTGDICGLKEDSTYEEEKISYEVGDTLILYTDGLIECENIGKEQYGKKRLFTSLLKNANCEALDFSEKIVFEAEEFYGEELRKDDITLVVTKFL